MSRYANRTEVPIEKSKSQIEALLRAHKASQFHTGWDATRDIMEFGWQGKQIRFVLPRVTRAQAAKARGMRGGFEKWMEAADRQRWRALLLVIRAKLEAVEAGIAIFEEEFLAHIVVPGRNETIGEIFVPRITDGSFNTDRLLPEGEVAVP
jgi:hypothetical protein